RVLFLVNHQCPIYCRFCTRKRKVSEPGWWNKETLKLGIDYIREHREVRDIIISGGDPMMLPDHMIEWILSELRAIPHVEILRIGSRVPCALPQRITPELCEIIKRYHPVYVNTHFNHPREVTEVAKKHCGMLADAGVPIGCQTVLLKGVNDDPAVMKELMQKLLTIRVRPYYIYQADLTKGTNYFRTRVEKGLEIIKGLRGHTSGLAVPHFVIDAPGGGGKIPLLPEYVVEINDQEVVMRNYEGQLFRYPQVAEPAAGAAGVDVATRSHTLRLPEPAALLD
ncbi:MAG TPA: KamA family radical SAM protein, partial [Chloroflexota bacterium]|nr:KamA family radical SAM protein [Chloroflexota bacterium]